MCIHLKNINVATFDICKKYFYVEICLRMKIEHQTKYIEIDKK